MKTALIFLISLSSIGVALLTKDRLTNTIWIFRIANGCNDTLSLKPDQKVFEYDCELNYTLKGSYRITKDTLLLIMKDDSHPEDHGKIYYFHDKYLISKTALHYIGHSELINGKWHDTKVKFDQNIEYLKLTNTK